MLLIVSLDIVDDLIICLSKNKNLVEMFFYNRINVKIKQEISIETYIGIKK